MNGENDIAIRINKKRINDFMKTRTFFFMLFCVSFMLLFHRRSHVLIGANFWAEDGKIFYAQMHNDGIISFLYPYAGYMHLIPRLTALIAMPFGVINGPHIVNFIALLLHTLPVLFLFTERFNFIGTAYKFFLAAYYILMPNAGETLGNIANIQWHTAIMLLMVTSADPPKNFTQKLHDMLILIFSGLSGPFIIFIIPFILLTGRDKRFKIIASCIAVIQIITVLATAQEFHGTAASSSSSVAAASVSFSEIIFWCIRVIDTRLIWGTFLPLPAVFAEILKFIPFLDVIVFLAFILPMAYFFIKGSKRFRICAIFGACVLLSSMFRVFDPAEDLNNFFIKDGGERYLMIPCLLLFTFIMLMLKRFSENKTVICRMKVYAWITAVIFAVGIISFSLFPRLKNINYKSDIINMYYPAQKGSAVNIPINPEGWTMTLIKK